MWRARIPLALAVVLLTAALGPAGAAAGRPSLPTLVAIRAAHHPGFDRLVFEFSGGLPAETRISWSDEPPTLDASGLPSGVQGNAYLQVAFQGVLGHEEEPPYDRTFGAPRRAYALPNVAHFVALGDFEAVVSFAIGVMRRTSFEVVTLGDPGRVVVDIGVGFPTRTVRTWFVDRDRLDGGPPYVVPVTRLVPRVGVPASVLHRSFAGPTGAERREGLRFVDSEATDWTDLRISAGGIARVRLVGGCDAHGSSLVSIASEILPALRALAPVDWVKIEDPDGTTEQPWGPTDSIPACLEP
jgi:hypothetical protein